MDVEKYIASGILELYLAGQLTEKENLEVARNMESYPEIKSEVEAIEASILGLSKASAPGKAGDFDVLKKQLVHGERVKHIDWFRYVGWAAAVLLVFGLWYQYQQNQQLESELRIVEKEMIQLEQQIAEANQSKENSEELLANLRDKDISVIPLQGQPISPDSYAKAYWNKEVQKVFIDAQGLPDPPEGKSYQVWSLTLDPLKPTSIGLLEDFKDDDNGIFLLDNIHESEAFGITLEPEGGSEFPNLEQLYALGTVSG